MTPEQIETSYCPPRAVMRRANFARGLADVRGGRAFDSGVADQPDDFWAYERGRQFGCLAPLNMPLFDGGKLNGKAVALFAAAVRRGLIL
jgi:hypothetical protein